MVRVWPVSAATACLLCAVLLTAASAHNAAAAQPGPPLSVWTYSYVEEYSGPNIRLSINGTMLVVCEGIVEMEWDGQTAETVLMTAAVSTDVDGWVREYDWFLGWRVYDLSGKYNSVMKTYHDAESGVILRSVLDEKLDVRTGEEWRTARSVIYYNEHNETVYMDVYTEPPHFGPDNISYGMEPGSVWSEGYRAVSEVSGVSGSFPFEISCDAVFRTNYTHIGSETLAGPAGELRCVMIRYNSGPQNVTVWYCPDIDGAAMTVSSYEGGDIECVLQSYDPGEVLEEGTEGLGKWLLPAVAVPVVAAAVPAAVFIWTSKRQKDRTPPPQGGGEVG